MYNYSFGLCRAATRNSMYQLCKYTCMAPPAACMPACLPAALIESIVLQLLHAGREEFPQASVATPT